MGDPSGGSVFVACRFRFRHGGQNASRIKGGRKDLAITIMRCPLAGLGRVSTGMVDARFWRGLGLRRKRL